MEMKFHFMELASLFQNERVFHHFNVCFVWNKKLRLFIIKGFKVPKLSEANLKASLFDKNFFIYLSSLIKILRV